MLRDEKEKSIIGIRQFGFRRSADGNKIIIFLNNHRSRGCLTWFVGFYLINNNRYISTDF